MIERHLAVDRHQRAARDDGELAEGGDADMVGDRLPVQMDAPAAGQKLAAGIRLGAGFAERRPAFGARGAVAAGGHEDHHDMVAGLKVGDAVAERLDDAARLVAERHRHRPRAVAIDHREIGMAEAGGRDSH